MCIYTEIVLFATFGVCGHKKEINLQGRSRRIKKKTSRGMREERGKEIKMSFIDKNMEEETAVKC